MGSRRKRFWLVGVFYFALFTAWMFFRFQLFEYVPWASHAAWVLLLVLFTLGLIFLQNEAANELKDQLTEFSISVFMAVAISIILVGEEDQKLLEKEKLVEAATIAFVIFAVTTIGRSGRSLKESAEMLETINSKFEDFKTDLVSLKSGIAQQGELYAKNQNLLSENVKIFAESHKASSVLQQATKDALGAINEAQFGGLAARALGLQHAELLKNDSGGLDFGIVKAVEPGLGALRAWIQVGKDLADEPARAAWWQVMNVYHQEEIYDVSSREVATNVRSYAYIILAVVSQLLSSLKDEEKLVVVNVSAFAPKDFYNFPNGQEGNKFYHEAEFFGIYRRLLAAITVSANVDPYRVIFANSATKFSFDAEMQPNGRGLGNPTLKSETVGDSSQLGWHLDPIWKLVLDCARLHLISWPIVGPRASLDGEDFIPQERRVEWGAKFPEENDPAKRLPYVTKRFLWAPTYADVSNLFRELIHYETRREWLNRVWRYEQLNISATYDGFKKKAARAATDQFQTRVEAMRSRCRAFCGIYLDDESENANLKARLESSWEHILDDLVSWLPLDSSIAKVRPALSKIARLSRPELIHSELGALDIPTAFGDEVEKYIHLMNKAWSTSIRLRDLVIGQAEYTKRLLELADDCHQIDSLGKYIQIETGRRTASPEHSSTGVELGPAENWLHRFVIWLEAARLGEEVRESGPIPLWKLMAHDLCGVAIKDLLELKEDMADKLRICTVGRKDDAEDCGPPTTTGDEMNENHIFPEFLMVGKLTSGKSGLKSVDWLALVGATISEPFQSCRIQLRFGKDDEQIKAHMKWLIEIWDRGKAPTSIFLDLLTKEIESLGHERSAERK
jgi:hypothetical protein